MANEPTQRENEVQESQTEGNAADTVTSLQFQFFFPISMTTINWGVSITSNNTRTVPRNIFYFCGKLHVLYSTLQYCNPFWKVKFGGVKVNLRPIL